MRFPELEPSANDFFPILLYFYFKLNVLLAHFKLQYDKCLFIGEAEGVWFHQRNHRNNVRISTDTSCEWKEMFRGCPKAQILNVFADDCVYNTDKSSIKMYGYDHQMYVDSEKMEEVERNLTNEN